MTLSQLKHGVADLARPAAIYATATAITVCAVGCLFVKDKLGMAAVITALGTIQGVLVGARTYENRTTTKANAAIEIAKATGAAP